MWYWEGANCKKLFPEPWGNKIPGVPFLQVEHPERYETHSLSNI